VIHDSCHPSLSPHLSLFLRKPHTQCRLR
jgi:hypothetical protein